MAIVCAAPFLIFFDTTVVSVAFPAIEKSFPGATHAQVALTLTGYATVIAALLLPSGRFADYLGRRRVFLAAFGCFTAASLACGLAPSLSALVLFRVLQGAGAACMVPSSLALALAEAPEGRRGATIGAWSGVAGAAALTGPALGGVLVDLMSWRLVFLVNVPIGIAVVLLGSRFLRETRDPKASRPDLLTVALATIAAACLGAGLFSGAESGWTHASTWALVGAAVTSCVALVVRGRAIGNPLVGEEVLAQPSIGPANAATFLISAAGYGLMLTNALFLSTCWHYSALQLGLAVSPGPMVTVLTAPPAGWLADRCGAGAVAIPGAIALAAGALWFATQVDTQPGWLAHWLPGALLTGTGVGLAFPTLGLAAVDPAMGKGIGTAIGLNGVMRQVGAIAGVAATVSLVGKPSAAGALSAARHGWIFVATFALLASLSTIPVLRGATRKTNR